MRTRALLALLAFALPCSAAADDEALLERIEQLEQRIRDLEADQPSTRQAGSGGDWTRFVRIGGSAEAGYFGGQENSIFAPDSFLIWDARVFVDAHLSDRVALGEQTVFRNVAFTFEWDLARIGTLRNQVGELYADFQGFLGQNALNFQLGRFQIPVGEAYLRYSQGRAHKPFVSDPVGGPWWWDEGMRFYGGGQDGRFGYVASLSDGETPFNRDTDSDLQFTLKLFARPLPWLYVSASGLRSGRIGSSTSAASGALWLGESWARAFGAGTSVPSYQDGVEIADGPNELDGTWLAAGDVVLDFEDKLRLWLAYGHYSIDSNGGGTYDRTLQYWTAETILRGSWLSPVLRPFYLGMRANALATYDPDRGYVLDFRRASTLGYNMKSLTAYSAVLGWDLSAHLRLRAEYTHSDVDLVRGVTPSLRDLADRTDAFAVAFGASF